MLFKRLDVLTIPGHLHRYEQIIKNSLYRQGVNAIDVTGQNGITMPSHNCFVVNVGNDNLYVGILNVKTEGEHNGPRTKFEVSMNDKVSYKHEFELTLFYRLEAFSFNHRAFAGSNNPSPIRIAMKEVLLEILKDIQALAFDFEANTTITKIEKTVEEL